jgi:hypothetical protein
VAISVLEKRTSIASLKSVTTSLINVSLKEFLSPVNMVDSSVTEHSVELKSPELSTVEDKPGNSYCWELTAV